MKPHDIKGVLNDSLLFADAQYLIQAIGTNVYEIEDAILEIECFKAMAPSDMHKIISVRYCQSCRQSNPHVYKFYQRGPTFTVRDTFQEICNDQCVISTSENKLEVSRRFEIEGHYYEDTFGDLEYLTINPNVPKNRLAEFCENKGCRSTKYFDFKNNTFYFNIESGYIHLVYYKNNVDEDGYPVYEENVFVNKAIQDYLEYRAYYYLMLSGDAKLSQMYSLMEVNYKKSLTEAQYQLNIPPRDRLLAWNEKRRNKYKALDTEWK